MAVRLIGAIVLLLSLFGLIVGTVGFSIFSETVQEEHALTTYHMADTAASLIRGDHLEAYLAGEEADEYQQTKAYLEAYCQRMHVPTIYVIMVDRSDYGRFVSVFNPVNNAAGNFSYTEWELGHRRDTTNDEYRRKYRAIYEQESDYETISRPRSADNKHPHITTLVPVKNSAGDVAAILCMQRPMQELEEARRPFRLRIILTIVLLAAAVSAAAAVYLRRQFVGPIRRASEEAARFARENTRGEPLGAVSRLEEIASLAASIDTMEEDMLRYIDNLTRVTAEREHISAELSVAAKIQFSAVPGKFPAFPDRPEFDIFASMTPAKEVGGDFYNFFLIDPDHLALVIGDVSGKGIPAALFMMVTNVIIHQRTQTGGTPAEILTYVNNTICSHNEADMFVTVWLGILELSTGRITAANAGHEDAAVCRADGTVELIRNKHGLAVGALPGIKYRDFSFSLSPGDRLFLYTDGVPEATDAENRMFTMDRMMDVLRDAKDKTPREILAFMHERVNAFVGDAPQFDDLTMLCLLLKETGGPAPEASGAAADA